MQGTKGLLASAAKEPKIQRVVITSSFAAVMNPRDPVFSESSRGFARRWKFQGLTLSADVEQPSLKRSGTKLRSITSRRRDRTRILDVSLKSAEILAEPSPNVALTLAHHTEAYCASKTMAERAGWEFISSEKPSFDLATINPPYIFGSPEQQVKSASSLNTSVAGWYAFLSGEKSDEDAKNPSGQFVDVRDVAQLHIEALTTPDAGGKRFLVSNSTFVYQDLLDVIHKPEHAELLKQFPKALKGVPGCERPKQNVIDTTRAQKTFGWSPISLEKTV